MIRPIYLRVIVNQDRFWRESVEWIQRVMCDFPIFLGLLYKLWIDFAHNPIDFASNLFYFLLRVQLVSSFFSSTCHFTTMREIFVFNFVIREFVICDGMKAKIDGFSCRKRPISFILHTSTPTCFYAYMPLRLHIWRQKVTNRATKKLDFKHCRKIYFLMDKHQWFKFLIMNLEKLTPISRKCMKLEPEKG